MHKCCHVDKVRIVNALARAGRECSARSGQHGLPAVTGVQQHREHGSLTRFIVYDQAARIGRAVPIWGGADSRVEHFFNRWRDNLVRWMMRLKAGKLQSVEG
jgi:hypothetical protein